MYGSKSEPPSLVGSSALSDYTTSPTSSPHRVFLEGITRQSDDVRGKGDFADVLYNRLRTGEAVGSAERYPPIVIALQQGPGTTAIPV